MAITLDGTNGINSSGVIVAPDGSASAPAITNDGDTNTGIFFPAADTIAFAEGGAEAMRIDSSGNVGIGTSSPVATGGGIDTASSSLSIVMGGNGAGGTGRTNNTAKEARLSAVHYTNAEEPVSVATVFNGSTDNDIRFGGGSGIVNAATILAFYTAANNTTLGGTERMRIDSSGGLILAGSTAQKATGTTWSNPSDQRLKDNIRDYNKGTAELMQVRVREWEYNGKGGTVEGTKGLGVVADEVMVVLPDTVENYEAKLHADDEEVTAIKKFDATEITWLLVKTVQELKAELDEAKARIAALEGSQT
jgi:hypothetical protein